MNIKSVPASSREAGTSRNFILCSQQCSGWPCNMSRSRFRRTGSHWRMWLLSFNCSGNSELQIRDCKAKAELQDKLTFPPGTQRRHEGRQIGRTASRRCHVCAIGVLQTEGGQRWAGAGSTVWTTAGYKPTGTAWAQFSRESVCTCVSALAPGSGERPPSWTQRCAGAKGPGSWHLQACLSVHLGSHTDHIWGFEQTV